MTVLGSFQVITDGIKLSRRDRQLLTERAFRKLHSDWRRVAPAQRAPSIAKLKDKGYSYRQIARMLSLRGIRVSDFLLRYAVKAAKGEIDSQQGGSGGKGAEAPGSGPSIPSPVQLLATEPPPHTRPAPDRPKQGPFLAPVSGFQREAEAAATKQPPTVRAEQEAVEVASSALSPHERIGRADHPAGEQIPASELRAEGTSDLPELWDNPLFHYLRDMWSSLPRPARGMRVRALMKYGYRYIAIARELHRAAPHITERSIREAIREWRHQQKSHTW